MKKLIISTVIITLMCLTTNHLAAQTTKSEYSKWYAGGTAGIAEYGSTNIPNTLGLHGAYFFNQKYGVGLSVRNIQFDNYKDLVFAPTFFAHWGGSNSKLFFPTRIGLGLDKHNYQYAEKKGDPWENVTEILFACYASAGISIRPSKSVSFGVNAEFASSFEWIEWDYFGLNFSISFHF